MWMSLDADGDLEPMLPYYPVPVCYPATPEDAAEVSQAVRAWVEESGALPVPGSEETDTLLMVCPNEHAHGFVATNNN